MHLNPSQQKAVECVTGPCLVLAGAGAGKTRVITNKIAYLIRHCGYQPCHIAAVTFTNKASREMKARVIHTLGQNEARGLTVATFHTLGLAIIQREYKAIGIKEKFSLFDEEDQLALLKELTEPWLKGDKDLLNEVISTISKWKNDLFLPAQAEAASHSEKDKLFAHFYRLYNNHLIACNILDFDDLILRPTKLLQHDNTIREFWQNQLRYLLVDEYQDTNTSQYELIKLLVGLTGCFTVVGDEDQSIYSWRGAQPRNLALLQKDFASLMVIKLEQNYRSTERILNAANALIANNSHIFEKKLFSKMDHGEPLKVITANNEIHETERVVGSLITHQFLKKTSYSDYAILYRNNYQSGLFEKMLIQNRIPYRISGGKSLCSRPEIKVILAYLRILTNPDDDSAFLRVVNHPRREIGTALLAKLGAWATHREKSLFTASFDLGLEQTLSGRGLKSLQQFTQWLKCLAHQAEQEPLIVVRKLIEDIDYNKWLYQSSRSIKAAEIRIKNVNTLYCWITEMLTGTHLNEAMTLEQVVTHFTLRDMIEHHASKEDLNQVQLMTLHASKGLEFSYVFLVGMEEGILPHQNSIADNNIEEERRLAYVGITRSKKELTFTLCRERRQYGALVKPEPSRFLRELPQNDLHWEQVGKSVSAEDKMNHGLSHLAKLRAQLAKHAELIE
ncbi:DNA helicase Rep [Candidatus Steffania adelgidicola]|uniref:DNA helicase Rep n=1 Tax=Candidatus Steffania adelgidicola TaxID=1076626 RepID=UPI001D00314C|nr:DNA helicase Rep [Candidatus Steffania adelgidicola]UDG79870.1 ATP-dependent DNA helicase Rep [Candidatus Steffania adelgidicola]